MKLPTDPKARKAIPMATGVLDYFPDALAEVAIVSKSGNDQHNPGQELHWAKEKSTDHADCVLRHLAERGTRDTDKMRHSAKMAWRALALLQTEIEAERAGMTVSQYVAKLKEEAKRKGPLCIPTVDCPVHNGEWIPWFGESNISPVDNGVKIEIRLRNRLTYTTCHAAGYCWMHTDKIDDIVAYRILKK
jgi:hypothetical protein